MKLLQSVVAICILLKHTATNMNHKYVTLSAVNVYMVMEGI